MVRIIIKRLQQITKSLSIVCAFIEAMGSDFLFCKSCTGSDNTKIKMEVTHGRENKFNR